VIRVRRSPRGSIVKLIDSTLTGVRFTRSEVAKAVGITYWSSRYWLEKLTDERVIRKEIKPWGRFGRRVYYFRVIPVEKEMVDATIVVYSKCVGKREEYKYRFQGFYDVDALRDVRTGVISYDAELTKKEIEYCIFDFRIRWNWLTIGIPASGTEEPVWVETSEFEPITEPKGAVCKSLSKIEEGEETYFSTVMAYVFFPTEEDKKRFKEAAK